MPDADIDSDDQFVELLGASDRSEANDAYLQVVREETAENVKQMPTQPGLYRMPCGDYVEFFLTAEGEERWLVPGHGLRLDRQRIAFVYRGDDGWQRMYTLEEAAAEFQRQAH